MKRIILFILMLISVGCVNIYGQKQWVIRFNDGSEKAFNIEEISEMFSREEPINVDELVKVRRITITQTKDAAEAQQMRKRASLVEDDGILNASWTAGDGLTYCNMSRMNYVTHPEDDYPIFGNLTATTTAVISQFTGDVECAKGDYLAVVYPVTTFETNKSYTISLTGQDGTLSTLATTYHYVYGLAHVKSVTETTANATMAKMKSLLTVCKFAFIDKTTGDAIPINTFEISYGGNGSDAGTYPQTAIVDIPEIVDTLDETTQDNVHATGVEGSSAPLSIDANGATEAYVALLPTKKDRTFNFTVTNNNGTYTGTAKAHLVEGEYVLATGLKLTRQ